MAYLPFEKTKRQTLIRKRAETSPKYGKRPQERSASELVSFGVVNIDKPAGPTSHQVSAYVQNILSMSKGGHSGTLDPNVTGSLPIAVGRATRVVEYLLSAGKEYVALMHVHKPIPESKIRHVCQEFIGKITQLPPVKSAVKRQERERSVYYLEILEIEGQDALFKVGTQAGTYIRKLIHDIGRKLGCGAHMVELRRTKAGPFGEDSLVTLQELSDACHYMSIGNDRFILKIMKPIESAASHLARVWVLDTTVDSICHGASLKAPGISMVQSGIMAGDMVAMMTLKDELVAVGKAIMTSERMQNEARGIAVTTDKVFMLPSTYPKLDKTPEVSI